MLTRTGLEQKGRSERGNTRPICLSFETTKRITNSAVPIWRARFASFASFVGTASAIGCRYFLSTATGYGTVGVKEGKPFLETAYGTIAAREIRYSPPTNGTS
jgi:hypothetical protein